MVIVAAESACIHTASFNSFVARSGSVDGGGVRVMDVGCYRTAGHVLVNCKHNMYMYSTRHLLCIKTPFKHMQF